MASLFLSVFLSSTASDLVEYRRAVIEAMHRLDHIHCDPMEYFGARDAATLPFCRERVGKCDIFVGLIGHFRGWEPDGDNGLRSITEMEHDWAEHASKPRLMFVAPDPLVATDEHAMTTEQRERQRAFRKRVMGRIVDQDFSSPDKLAAAVMAALANHLLRPVLLEMQRGIAPRAEPTAPQRQSLWRRVFGTRAPAERADLIAVAGSSPPVQPQVALAQFAVDPDFAVVMRDPGAFDVRELEAAITQRAEARARAGRAGLKAAAADYKRLAALAGLYDINKARAAYARAAEIDPRDADALYWLGRLSMDAGNTREAEAAFLRLDALQGADIDPRDAIWGQFGLGDLRVSQGQLPPALTAFRKGRDQADRLAKADPDNAGWLADLAASHGKIGLLLALMGQRATALATLRQGRELVEPLVRRSPDHAQWQNSLESFDRHIARLEQ